MQELVTSMTVGVIWVRVGLLFGNQTIEISPREFEILQQLIAHADETVIRELILNHICGETASLFTRTIDAHITRLRHKIEPNLGGPVYIVTAHRVGYRLVSSCKLS